MRERDVEKYLVARVEKLGGECWKWNGRLGVPDRIVLLSGGRVIFVEVKTDGGRLSKMQLWTHRKLTGLGMDVVVVWSKEDVDRLMESV